MARADHSGWQLRVIVIDDHIYAREGLTRLLDQHADIEVVRGMSHDDAAVLSDAEFGEFDCAIVDVIDEIARNEVGTDVFSGIAALVRLRSMPVRTFAITPYRHHPVVEQRIYQSGADYLYRVFEINDLEWFVGQLLSPSHDHQVKPVSRHELRKYGAETARANEAVAVYERSAISGSLGAGTSHSSLARAGIARRTVDRFVREVQRTGFGTPRRSGTSPDAVDRPARFPDVKLYLLTLVGRADGPPTNVDERPEERI